MTTITIDDATIDKLRDLREPTCLQDKDGVIVGEFLPAIDRSAYAGLQSLLSQEEVRRREQQTDGFTTAEVRSFLDRAARIEPPTLDDPAAREAALREMIERMSRASVSPSAFPLTREDLERMMPRSADLMKLPDSPPPAEWWNEESPF